jgi:plasmid stabilization system protein ParE
MAYLVRTTARADRDLAELFETIHATDSQAALRWFLGLERSILSLENQPHRCPATPENKGLRHLLYGKRPHVYRIIYRPRERTREVEILHIRHGARDRFDETAL